MPPSKEQREGLEDICEGSWHTYDEVAAVASKAWDYVVEECTKAIDASMAATMGDERAKTIAGAMAAVLRGMKTNATEGT